ncbi:MAG: Hsp20/alpha crystallin family protein [Bacteriovoracales bacterium]
MLIFLLGGIVFATGTKLYLDAKNRPAEVVQAQPIPKKRSFFGRFFDDDFFGEEVLDQMAKGMEGMDNLGEVAKLETSENDQYVIYEIFLDLIDKNSLKIDIKDGQITLSGQERIEKENKGDYGVSKSISVSSFTRSFPAPQGVKAEEVQIEHKEKSIILKFPKTPKI